MKKSAQFFYACLSFLLGVSLGEIIDLPNVWFYAIVAIFINVLFFKSGKTWHFRLKYFLLILLVAYAGVLLRDKADPQINETHIASLNEQKVEFMAIISAEPDRRLDKMKLTVAPLDYDGLVLLNTSLYPEFEYGEKISVQCRLQAPEPIEDFSYDKYLARYGIYSVCYRPYIKKIDQGFGNPLMAGIFKFKKDMESKINRTVAEPQAALTAGILIGSRQGMPEYLNQQFNHTGITHIIAISGFNITIIIVILMNTGTALRINRKKMIWLIALGLIFFVILTGASASVVRAAIMGFIVALAKHLGRTGNVRNVLILSAVIMTTVNPKILVWDAGFQLSFISTIGLIYFSPILMKVGKWLPETFGLRENTVSTLSAIIFTLPFILFQFGRLSIVAPIVNMLVLPIIPLAMLIGFFQVLFAYLWLPLGEIIGWFSWLLLGYVIKIVDIFAKLSWASVEIEVEWWTALLMYILLFTMIIIFINKKATSGKVA